MVGKLDIVFVVSHTHIHSEFPPIYFLYLAGYLERNGFSCKIFNEPIADENTYIENAIRFILQEKPKCVSLSAFVTDYLCVLKIAKEIKSRTHLPIIIGNAQPSISPEDFIFPGSPFDIAVIGEGEKTVLDIVSGCPFEKINGIVFLDTSGATIHTPKRKLMDLKNIGTPAYHLVDMKRYITPTKFMIRRLPTAGTTIYTGRGCPYRCGFCAANTVWNTNDHTCNPIARHRPIETVITELEQLERGYNSDFFYILDDTFGLTKKDVIDFCDAYIASGLTMLWACETRVTSPIFSNVTLLHLMKKAGCIQIDFGVETGSEKLLETIGKDITITQIVNAFMMCDAAGIRTYANMLLNLPGETKMDLILNEQLIQKISPTYIGVGITQPYPGTRFYSELGYTIPKEEYCSLDRMALSKEYRMAAHHISLQPLLLKYQYMWGCYSMVEWSLRKTDLRYWKKVLTSRWLLQYLYAVIRQCVINSMWEWWVMRG